MPVDFLSAARALEPWLIEHRRDFHQYPELGFYEFRTAGIVAQELNSLGLEVRSGVAKTGVIALLKGDKPGPVVLARFDMDALPIQEANTVDYISRNPSAMHACGHDGHTAIGLAVARMLTAHREEIHGTVKFVFQPAEELGGARLMVEEGVLENPSPDTVLGLHLWNLLPAGKIAVTDGPVMAASEQFSVRVMGNGGHGGIPDKAKDPVVAAAHIITALQSIVARNVSPLDSGVVSVTAFKTVESFNVIPESAELRGTIRSFKPGVRYLLLNRVREIAAGVGQALGCSTDIDLQSIAPPVVNSPEVAARVRKYAKEIFGTENVMAGEVAMGAEGIAFLMETIPGCYFFIGSANAERGLNYGHHHPRFNFDETVMVPAAALMASVVAGYVIERGFDETP